MAENSPETPQVKKSSMSPEAVEVRDEERARCAAIARTKSEGRFPSRRDDDIWKGACKLIAEAIERDGS